MWMEALPLSKQDATTRCNSCTPPLREQQRQEEDLRKSNMAHVVFMSAKSVAHEDGQGHDTKTEQIDQHSGEQRKPCISCGQSFPKQGIFSDRMWMQKGSIRKCDICVAATARNAQTKTKPCVPKAFRKKDTSLIACGCKRTNFENVMGA